VIIMPKLKEIKWNKIADVKTPNQREYERRIKVIWDWIERPVPDEFFDKRKTKITKEEFNKLIREIPPEVSLLAEVMYKVAVAEEKSGANKAKKACLRFRSLMFKLYKEILEEEKIDLCLPYYWFCDGIMIEPEWIVKITNGLLKFKCDDSVTECGMGGRCRFYKSVQEQEREKKEEELKEKQG